MTAHLPQSAATASGKPHAARPPLNRKVPAHYQKALQHCQPFLIAADGLRGDLNLAPGGLAIPQQNQLHPQHRRHAEFLRMLQLLDRLTFGPFGMEMPSWVFYDCAVMPGAVFGLAMPAASLEPWAREALQVPADYTGLIPVSQFIAIPMLQGFGGGQQVPGTWLVYTLESLNQVSPGIGPAGLLELTLFLGLQVFPIAELWGTTQWRSPKLTTYADLGPLELVTAYTPAHSLPRTLSFRLPVEDLYLTTLLVSPRMHPEAPPANALLDVDDVHALIELQQAIEGGEEVRVVGHPVLHGADVRVPLYRSSQVRSSLSSAEQLAHLRV